MDQAARPNAFDVTFTLRGDSRASVLRLRNPDRVAIDFPSALPAAALSAISANPLVSEVRHGLVAADRYRFIFKLAKPADAALTRDTVEGGEKITLAFTPAARPTGGVSAAAAPRETMVPTSAPAPREPKGRAVVVIDPGHGGIDNGAVSKSGTQEKAINLAFSRELAAALEKTGTVEVVLTRRDDTFIPLDERSQIGRRRKADLFVSIHADSIRHGDLRGATVYTLSDRASDDLASQIADSENAADRFAGPEGMEEKPEVFDILVDLTRRETVSFSEHFATSLVEGFGAHDVRLIKNPKRSAGFKVLRAPDMPSVLVELGYLSNPDDEKLLTDPVWRKRTAEAIAQATTQFLARHQKTVAETGR
ncbi:N-acetylmuramoyl-L-alanine amidase [Aurantimonas sp. Leaf443]|nr:N-acetylmuramoyl-L-alanine amidase [Aurantimonas sp. Leaf443]